MKKEDRTAAEKLLSILPEEAPEHVRKDNQIMDDLGQNIITFKRASVRVEPDMYDWLSPNHYVDGHKGWGSECKCFSCGDTWIGGWEEGKLLLCIGEDGEPYDGYIDKMETGMDMVASFVNGETVECPHCGEQGNLTTVRELKHGKTLRTQTASLESIGEFTVIMYWLCERNISRHGYSRVLYYPRQAVGIMPSGTLVRYEFDYSEKKKEWNWRIMSECKEPALVCFSVGGYRSASGCWYVDYTPEMKGTTGEKTGIEAYWGNFYPVNYLKIWQKIPQIESLAKTGANTIIEHFVGSGVEFAMESLDCNEKKPHRILKISKEDYSIVTNYEWHMHTLESYRDYKKIRPKETAKDWQSYLEDIELNGCDTLRNYWNLGLGKLIRYFKKQEPVDETGPNEAGIYNDYRRMLEEMHRYGHIETYTEEEIWPRSMRAAHDRMIEYQTVINSYKMSERFKKYEKEFSELKQNMKELEWTDGQYTIIIPDKPEDLIREGNILHHCVGTYVPNHCHGNPIFFVRHYRRPERPWFTLNENMNDSAPYRIQLHGYRNECVSGKRLRIPERVLEFVDTWERDILAPWMKNRKGVTA